MADFIRVEGDVLIIGGGAAGCMAAIRLKELEPSLRVVILEQAALERSGRLATGLAILSPYLHRDETVESYLAYLASLSRGPVDEVVVRPLVERCAEVISRLTKLGLPIEKGDDTEFVRTGRWGILCHGENLKPILARRLLEADAHILHHVTATGLLLNGGRVVGATGFHVRSGVFHLISAPAVLLATGSTTGLYRSALAESTPHRMMPAPFNAGAGLALGLRVGLELVGLEHRSQSAVLAGSLAPVDILIEGYRLPALNARGEPIPSTGVDELTGAVIIAEAEGKGPCYIETTRLSTDEVERITVRYLESHPAAVLHWRAEGVSPNRESLELALSEPFVGGLDSPAGLAVDPERRTTLTGLYAAGETAGGTPKKGITGVFAEALIAAEGIAGDLVHLERAEINEQEAQRENRRINEPFLRLSRIGEGVGPHEFEQRLQRMMDTYAGGCAGSFRPEGNLLVKARRELQNLTAQIPYLIGSSNHDAVLCLRAQNRLLVARALVEHLIGALERKHDGELLLSALDSETGAPAVIV